MLPLRVFSPELCEHPRQSKARALPSAKQLSPKLKWQKLTTKRCMPTRRLSRGTIFKPCFKRASALPWAGGRRRSVRVFAQVGRQPRGFIPFRERAFIVLEELALRERPRAIRVVANLDISQNCLHSLLVDLVEDEKVYFHSLTVNRLERAPIRVALHDLSHTPDHHRPINCVKRSNNLQITNISSVRPSPNASAPHRSAFDLSHRRRRPRRPRTRSRGAIARTFSSSRRLASSFAALAQGHLAVREGCLPA